MTVEDSEEYANQRINALLIILRSAYRQLHKEMEQVFSDIRALGDNLESVLEELESKDRLRNTVRAEAIDDDK